MTRSKCPLAITLCLLTYISLPAAAQSPDEAELRTLAESFLSKYRAKDLDGMLSLWNRKSPHFEVGRNSLQRYVSDNTLALKTAAIRDVQLGADGARVRAIIELRVSDPKAPESPASSRKLNRNLHWTKQGGAWRLERYVTAEEDLAQALLASPTEEARKALLEAEKELTNEDLQRALTNLADNLVKKADFSPAVAAYRLAHSLAEQLGYALGMVVSLNGLGEVYSIQGNYPESLTYYLDGLKHREKLKEKNQIARAISGIGTIHLFRGEYTEALRYYREALQIGEELGSKVEICRASGNIGLVYYVQGSYAEALEHTEKGLELAQELGNDIWISGSLNSLGIIRLRQGNYLKALEHYLESQQISEKIGDKPGIIAAYNNIGQVHLLQGNYLLALDYFRKSVTLAEPLDDKMGIFFAWSNTGEALVFQKKYTQSLEYFEKSRKLAEEMGNKVGAAWATQNIGVVHRMLGNYAAALEHYEAALKTTEQSGNKTLIATTLGDIASTHYLQGDYANSSAFAGRSAAIAEAVGDVETLWGARTTEARAQRALKQPDRARQALVDAIKVIEELREGVAAQEERQRFFENKVEPYYEMVDLLVSGNNAAEAFGYAERAKSRVLLEVLNSGKVDITKAMTAEELERERRLTAELVSLNSRISQERLAAQADEKLVADLNAKLEKARLEFESFHTYLYAAHPELKVQRGRLSPLGLPEAIALIPNARTAVVEYVVGEDRTYLFALTKEPARKSRQSAGYGLKVYKLDIGRQELGSRIETFRQRLANRDWGFQEYARQLFDLLIKPAWNQLADKTELVIVPDRDLWELPFQVLQPSTNRYLIDHLAISYAPSLTVLREMSAIRKKRSNSPRSPETLLAFGNPSLRAQTVEHLKSALMGERLGPLPEAEKQVRLLGRLYGAQSKIYVGEAASEHRLKADAGKHRVLHLATHGILNDSSPLYSHLLLSQIQEEGKSEDGLLEAWEIMKLDLQSDLAVLSACETARGRIGAGEGVIGLTWALFVAGCPTTVVSQWKVESASTADLMFQFHRYLRSGLSAKKTRLSKAEALRRAELRLMRSGQYKHPFYWAGFVVVGDGR